MTLGHRTNAIYQDAVSAALDLEIDILARAGERLVDRELARTFGSDDLVLHELRRLRVLNAATEHYDLGAYHNALMHAVVADQIEVLNEAHAVGRSLISCSGRGGTSAPRQKRLLQRPAKGQRCLAPPAASLGFVHR
ncbi:MAG: hypothetical protein H6835_05265 [Planctomycetes bacterium]|nr:hypothetical protein [Planctomycetota bacterium]